MASDNENLTGPDLTHGIRANELPAGGMLQGYVRGEAVLLVHHDGDVVAIGANCTHYGTPLVGGIVVDGAVRCPLHHACFSLKTGKALRAPAFDGLKRWDVEQRDGQIYVGRLIEDEPENKSGHAAAGHAPAEHAPAGQTPASQSEHANVKRIVIVGGGAAGNAAAEKLRSEGFAGSIIMLSADASRPCDRPNFSKGTIAGTIEEDFNYLRPADFYDENNITLRLNTHVSAIDTKQREVVIDNKERVPYDVLLLATGAEPIKLTIPGAELPHVRTLRTLADSLEIAKQAESAKIAVVIGASFIGLEVAASLRARDLEVHVVAPEDVPMTRVLGAEVGAYMQALHEKKGVHFHLGTTVVAIESNRVQLKDGSYVPADLVVVGIGVKPATALATDAGLTVDNGVVVNAQLETSAPGVFAAGDIARWPSLANGQLTRVEHWVVAERQGQTAALNMMGAREAFDAVPYFWTEQYDVTLLYVGHTERGFTSKVIGSLDVSGADCRIEYQQDDKLVAVATIGRDLESLKAEVKFERGAYASHP